jgi:hypothetical protein
VRTILFENQLNCREVRNVDDGDDDCDMMMMIIIIIIIIIIMCKNMFKKR